MSESGTVSSDGTESTPGREDPRHPPRGWLRRAGRWLGGAFVVGSFVFWAWAFSPWARSENPARLDDRAFAAWADQRCVQAQAAIDGLPTARQAQSRIERADQVDQGTAEVESLVDDLRRTAESSLSAEPSLSAESSLSAEPEGSGADDADLVSSWLDDWDTYISDRRSHAERLRTASDDTPDRELRFLLVDMVEGSTYTERMDGFARLNDMDACQIPGDV